jgi:hypothetical protein
MGELKIGLWIYGICQVLAFLVVFTANDQLINHDAGASIGLANSIAGILLLVISVIIFIMQKRELGRSTLLAGGLLLVTGAIACSVFPFKLN